MDERELGAKLGTMEEKVGDLEKEVERLNRMLVDKKTLAEEVSAWKRLYHVLLVAGLLVALVLSGVVHYWYFTGGFEHHVIEVINKSLTGE